MIQWVAILIAVCSGVYVVLTGDPQLGIGVIAAALSSAHVVTNKLPRCVSGSERRLMQTDIDNSGVSDVCQSSMNQTSNSHGRLQ